MDEHLDSCIQTVIKNYEQLIELSQKERACLITIDIDGISCILKEKENYLRSITNCLSRIKEMDTQKNQLLKYKSKIIQISNKFLYENSINAKIAQQHLAFSSSILNFYSNFMQLNQTYNNKASVPYKSNFNRMV
ncbi:hypothetical protein [Desulfurella sp.]|uniref:hypothetical protein n=1 Tax=Desulfurella sp. TaxID=1962857 RepID=UPI003D0F4F6C